MQLIGRGTEPYDADIVFLRSGLQIIPRSEEYDRVTLGWRMAAPYLRADSALGRQLADKEVELAPVGTQMPELPPETWMYRALDHDLAITRWWTQLSPELQADVRLIEPGALIIAPGHERSELPNPQEWEPARWIGPLATLGMREVSEDDTLRAIPGATNEEEDYAVTAGTQVYTVDGLLGHRRSSPRRGWCYAATCEDRGGGQRYCFGGWIRARNLDEIAADPGAAAPPEVPAED